MSLLRSTPTQTARGVLKTNVKRVLVMSGTLGASSSCYQVPFEILRKNTSLPPLPQIKSLSGRLHKTTHGMQGIASNLLEGGFLQDDNRKAGTKKTPKVDVLLRELRWRPLKAHNWFLKCSMPTRRKIQDVIGSIRYLDHQLDFHNKTKVPGI